MNDALRSGPVLVGIGTATQRVTNPSDGVDAIGLIGRALTNAIGDASVDRSSLQIDEIFVPQGSWSFSDPGRAIAQQAGIDVGSSIRVELGVLQSAIMHRACRRLAEGDARCVVVAGGEARHRALQRSIAGLEDQPQADFLAESPPDEHWEPPELVISRQEIDAGLIQAVSQYALVENAVRVHDGFDLATHRQEIASLWERFNAVALTSEDAWYRDAMSAAEIDAPSSRNRPLAFPYNKWHSTQWNVDQAVALVLTTVEQADALGVAEDRRVYPLAGADSNAVVPVTERAEMYRFVGAEAVFEALQGLVPFELSRLPLIDLYSCFPVAVRLQARALGLDAQSTPTISGGMTFAGGPFNNYVLQAMAVAARKIRATQSSALVSAVSGLLTKHGATVLSGAPLVSFEHRDCTADVVSSTTRIPIAIPDDRSEGVIVTYTVHYDGLRASEAVLLCETRTGDRVIAFADEQVAEEGTRRELIGRPVVLSNSGGRVIGELR